MTVFTNKYLDDHIEFCSVDDIDIQSVSSPVSAPASRDLLVSTPATRNLFAILNTSNDPERPLPETEDTGNSREAMDVTVNPTESSFKMGKDFRTERSDHSGCFACLEYKWPRAFAIVFKVMIPLLSLIVLSMIFGFWLAHAEG